MIDKLHNRKRGQALQGAIGPPRGARPLCGGTDVNCGTTEGPGPLWGRWFLEGALEERREDDLGLRAGDARVVAEALERLLEVGGVARADVDDRARLARHRVGG